MCKHQEVCREVEVKKEGPCWWLLLCQTWALKMSMDVNGNSVLRFNEFSSVVFFYGWTWDFPWDFPFLTPWLHAAGANKGRHFFVCPRARDEQCDFFAWAVRRPRMDPSSDGFRGGSPGWLMLSLLFWAKRWLWLKHVKSVDLQFWHQNWNLMIIDLTWRNHNRKHSLIILHSVYSFVHFCMGPRHQMQNVFRVRSRSDSRCVTTKHVQSGNIYPLVI